MVSVDQASPNLAQEFVAFAVDCGVLRFGEFTTKAGRQSPYFFNAGLFDDGAKLGRLAQFYAQRLMASGIAFDMIFGPAYKGIPLGAAVAIELARLGKNVPFAYNRKEAKDHGEGGSLDEGNRFARSGTCAHHVVDDQHPALQGRAYQRAAFAMVFGLFAVVGKGHGFAQPRQLHRHCRTQRDALVGGPKNHVKRHAAVHQALCVARGQVA